MGGRLCRLVVGSPGCELARVADGPAADARAQRACGHVEPGLKVGSELSVEKAQLREGWSSEPGPA
ncbi:hypothetical protein PC116_g33423 [Phytophthora cactorum]|nr:hypothetical protein PC116_g33423 [Phytophthora cactorum]